LDFFFVMKLQSLTFENNQKKVFFWKILFHTQLIWLDAARDSPVKSGKILWRSTFLILWLF